MYKIYMGVHNIDEIWFTYLWPFGYKHVLTNIPLLLNYYISFFCSYFIKIYSITLRYIRLLKAILIVFFVNYYENIGLDTKFVWRAK